MIYVKKMHLQEEGARKSLLDEDRRDTIPEGWIKVNACAGESLNSVILAYSTEAGVDASLANGENSWDERTLRGLEL